MRMRMTIFPRAARVFAVFALLLALTASLSAQDLAAWFAKAANQAAYGAIAAEAQILAANVRAASLSDSLLAARLEEAARKRVPASVLLATLKEDTARYLSVSVAFRGRGLLPSDAKKASTMVEQVALLLRGGIAESELDAALDAAVAKLGAKAANNAAVTRAVAALSVVANAKAQYGFSEENCRLLAIALVQSSLSDKKLDTLFSSLKNFVANGGSVDDALNSVIATMSKGKSAEIKDKASEKSNSNNSREKENQEGSENSESSGKSENSSGRKK